LGNIELVIKIPEEIRIALINNSQLSLGQWRSCDSCIKEAIINGTPLPKGHGKIIDESAITEVYTDETESVKINGMMTIPPRIVITSTNAPTIIGEDVESGDKE
jgi:hypothetical protein